MQSAELAVVRCCFTGMWSLHQHAGYTMSCSAKAMQLLLRGVVLLLACSTILHGYLIKRTDQELTLYSALASVLIVAESGLRLT